VSRRPTLSVLAPPDVMPLVEATIAFAVQRVIADNPELLWPPDVPRRRASPRVEAARAVVVLFGELLDAFRCYRGVRARRVAGPPPTSIGRES